jgi:DNA polymerase I-like protein with 3'-5' exonuclease and polymerase domains
MRQLIDEILKHDLIALDTETTGLNVRKDRVIGVGAATRQSSIYIPLLIWDGTELVATSYLDDAMYLLKALKNKKLVLHNAAYDLRIIKHDLGIDLLPALYCDTILLKHTVDEVPPFGLKEIALKHAKVLGYDRDPTIEKKAMEASITAAGGKHTKDCYELYKADAKLIGDYCEQDCKLTLAVFDFYSAKLIEENLEDFYYKDEVLPLYKEVSIPMMERGIKLDLSKIRELKASIEKELVSLEVEVQDKLKEYSSDFKLWFFEKEYPAKPAGNFAQEVAEYFNLPLPKTATGRFSLAKAAVSALPDGEVKSFLLGQGELSPETIAIIRSRIHGEESGNYFVNINSKDHLKRIIFNFLGEKPERHTEKGAYQLDDDYLHSLENTYSFIPPLLVYNKLNKIRATYIDRFLNESEDGIFYPQFNQHRTISGRFGSDIQQLPRKMEEGNALVMKYTNAIREFFISRPFHSFVDIDYESLEPHIFSAVSGDKGLQDIFNKNQDFYSTIAIMTERLEGVSADKNAPNYLGKINKAARQKSKSYCLGVPYGMGSFKLSKELNISQDEAQRLIDQYMRAFPNLKRWMDTTDDSVKKLGYVTSLVGRKRRMPEAITILRETGPWIFDSLQIWKDFHESPTLYEEMKEKRRKITNYINNGRNFQIQSLGASVINRACIAIARRFKELKLPAHITLQCHDEVLVECKTEQKELIAKEMQFIMENIIELPVKLKAPPSFGTNYANAK